MSERDGQGWPIILRPLGLAVTMVSPPGLPWAMVITDDRAPATVTELQWDITLRLLAVAGFGLPSWEFPDYVYGERWAVYFCNENKYFH